jgi:hypothetical protein
VLNRAHEHNARALPQAVLRPRGARQACTGSDIHRYKLKQHRGVVRRPTGRRWVNLFETHLGQIERIDKDVDYALWMARGISP